MCKIDRIRCAHGLGYNLQIAVISAVVLFPALRLTAETVTPSPYWRNTISFPDDAFRAQEYGPEDPGWIKFTIFKSDLNQVYFQDSNHFPFHYDFGHALVKEYEKLSHQQFDDITLHPATQQAVLGAVIMPHWAEWPPAPALNEYGIQLVGLEPYDPAFVLAMFNRVRTQVAAPPGTQVYYFPSFEQEASAEEHRAFFEANGLFISSPGRWATQNAIYSTGWALGTLKFFAAAEITPAYQSGQLLPADILLTDGVPAEVPLVAGIVSLVPSTPNSHVAILSKTFNIPFTYLAVPEDAARALQLVGRRVVLRALYGKLYFGPTGIAEVRLLDAERLTALQVDELLALAAPPPLDIAPVAPRGAISANTHGLYPADIRYFGGKAANFGLIRRSIPGNSPVAAAFSFDVWTAFMSQQMGGGKSLAQVIHDRLAGHTYPPHVAALSADLAYVRDLIEDDTAFTPALQQAVVAALQEAQYGFDPNRNIRFRSSTNMEDAGEFTGAGMYDSFSGCLADDLDGDSAGPSICDPTESKERGVFRAIRKVYASFYNENAFIERLRRSVNETDVGMALLVHHSYPDDIELANGVGTLEKRGAFSVNATLVTQKGAVSVTNPPAGSIPEQVDAFISGGNVYPGVVTHSNLVPLGATVLEWDSDYRQLVNLMRDVAGAFESATGKTRYTLDFEYKKLAPAGRLEVKQVREVPMPDTTADTLPFLLGEPVDYCTFQGEAGDVFANHRLKARLRLQPRSDWLTPDVLEACLYEEAEFEYAREGLLREMSGAPASWPAFQHTFASNKTTDTWRIESPENPALLSLTTAGIGVPVSDARAPVVLLSDLNGGTLELYGQYAKEVPIVKTWDGRTTTKVDMVRLEPCPRPATTDIPVERIVEANGVHIRIRFFWPKDPGAAAGYTAPLVRWDETVITGLTSAPIVLRGWYSQTYRPEHHNFSEHFLFEPELEPGLPESQRAELRALNIRLIYTHPGYLPATIETSGFVAPGDFDQDGRVDASDLEHFVACRSCPACPQPEIDCQDADLDRDGDVDQDDFGRFQRCMSGDEPARPDCLTAG